MFNTTVAEPKNVLILDDDPVLITTIQIGLSGLGYNVYGFEKYEDADEFISNQVAPDIALIDIQLSEKSGLDFVERLMPDSSSNQRNTNCQGIPFIFFTSSRCGETLENACKKGAMGYLVKPADFGQIVAAIEVAIAKSQELQKIAKRNEELQKLLHRDQLVSVAAGVIMMHYKLNSHDAHELIRKYSRDRNLKLKDAASEVINAAENLNVFNEKLRVLMHQN